MIGTIISERFARASLGTLVAGSLVTGLLVGLAVPASAAISGSLMVAQKGPNLAVVAIPDVSFKNVETGKCLTIAGGRSQENNVEALQFDCDADASRRWRNSA